MHAAAALAGSAVGPALAGLHESGLLSVGPAATLWPLGFIVMGAAVGIAVGSHVARRGSRLLGVAAALTNLAVLVFYGFLLLFFGLGGSR